MTANDVAILTTSQMAEADRLAIKGGIPGMVLMEAAGEAVADVASGMDPDLPIHVLCGPGNNGGDGFVAARLLADAGRNVRLYLLGDRASLNGDAEEAANLWSGDISPLKDFEVEGESIVIDALFGAGLTRALEGEAGRVAIELNDSDVIVVSVDVPSGVDGTTGQGAGPVIIADETVTFFRLKPAHVLFPARGYCGDVTLCDIGIPDEVLDHIEPQTFLNDPDLWLGEFPFPRTTQHKFDRGHALVVSGDALHTGAARLAAYGALRAGAGLVTLGGARDALDVHAHHVTSIMLAEAETDGDFATILSDPRMNAVIIGPAAGIGPHTRVNVETILKMKKATVLDADALTSFEGDAEGLFALLHDGCVLTPHEGEFERLFPGLLAKSSDRLHAARQAAQMSGAVVLLKGPDTVIASPSGRAAVTANAPPWLATAGSGDVLAGIIGGLLAQGMAAFEAASAGAWIHGECGRLGGPGLISEDLPDYVPEVLVQMLNP